MKIRKGKVSLYVVKVLKKIKKKEKFFYHENTHNCKTIQHKEQEDNVRKGNIALKEKREKVDFEKEGFFPCVVTIFMGKKERKRE